MKRFSLFILFVSSVIMVYSQRTAKVSASYTYYAPETMSVEEAKRIALERAKIQAIADEFGTIVSQSTSTVISNKNGETDTQFFSLGGSDVKGEWLETIGEPTYQIQFDEHLLIVTCLVNGFLRELTYPTIDFEAKILRNGTTLKYESTEFKNGDDMFLYFKSPVSGFLAVFLVDEGTQTVYGILPYRDSNGEPQKIIADIEYVFFSKKDGSLLERKYIDEYTLTAENNIEFNDLYLIFSPTYFPKALMNMHVSPLSPKSVSLNDFQEWLLKTKKANPNITIKKNLLTISKQ